MGGEEKENQGEKNLSEAVERVDALFSLPQHVLTLVPCQ